MIARGLRLRCALAVIAALLLPGCVTFERPPVATLDCDPGMAGHWRVLGEVPTDHRFDVSADCTLRWPEPPGGSYTTTLAGFALDGERYLVFTAAVADRLLGERGALEARTPKGDVLLARYRVDGDQATVWLADTEHAADPGEAGMARATTLENGLVRIRGSEDEVRRLLQSRGTTLFGDRSVMHLQRDPEAAP